MLSKPLVVILRGVDKTHLAPISKILQNVGIDTVEITMNTKGAPELIAEMKRLSEGTLSVGAGTVCSISDLHSALNAGAEFIVTPVLNEEVVKSCVERKIPVFPGALTPTEVWRAWELGATMVKVFPADAFGPKYLKTLHGPLNQIKLMAVGGVNLKTINEYFNYGAEAVAIGGSIFSAERLNNMAFDTIESDLKELIKNI